MSICNPSQYECDNMKQGDLIVVQNRPLLYKWYRAHFQKDKLILNLRKDWNTSEKVKAYQEDCTLLFSWEILGKSEFIDEVPYFTGYDEKYIKGTKKLHKLQFGSENISIVLKSGLSILIPTNKVRAGLDKMDNTRQTIDEQRQIQQALKFARYKGDFFKQRQKELNKDEWIINYCIVCGNPIKIKFGEENPQVENTCNCGNMVVKNEPIDWDTVAYWFNRQINPIVIKKYKKFWEI